MKFVLLLFVFSVSTVAQAEVDNTIMYTTTIDSKMRQAKKSYSTANYKKAFKMFNELARLGMKEAQFMTGMMLIRGKGQAKNMVRGVSWLYTASEANSKWVTQADRYFATISRSEKKEVQALVSVFIERFGMDSQLISCRKKSATGSHVKKVICTKQRDVRTPLFSEEGELLANVTVQKSPNDMGFIGANPALKSVRAATTQ
jgi:hypothetical protein